jgi:thiol-disulfide isomerase/thioredoxin
MAQFRWVLAACMLSCSVGAFSQTLTIGDDAPPIKVEKWLRSTPLEGFEKGKIYVLDFWATWCPSCRETIPRLSQLAKKYSGKVVVAGISVGEAQKSPGDLGYVAVVRKFVESQGTKMEYHVAADRPEGSMAAAWMDAAGATALPTTFVIDRRGKIAWIGDPRGLDQVLEQELKGTYDIKGASAFRARDKSQDAALADPVANGTVKALVEAIGNQDWKKAEQTCDVIIVGDPRQEKQYGPIKFLALLQTNDKGAYSYARRLSAGLFKTSSAQLTILSQMILSDKYGPKNPDLGFAMRLAQQSVDVSGGVDPAALDALADAQYRAKEPEKALATEEKALHLLDTTKLYQDQTIGQLRSLINKHLTKIREKR